MTPRGVYIEEHAKKLNKVSSTLTRHVHPSRKLLFEGSRRICSRERSVICHLHPVDLCQHRRWHL